MTSGVLEATTMLDVLAAQRPERFSRGQLRTLQRRVRDWRALHGPGEGGVLRAGACARARGGGRLHARDRARRDDRGGAAPASALRVRAELQRLALGAVAFGETFEALVAGVQGALWALGGVPEVLRSDNLSAATHELKRSGGRALTARFQAVLEHYGMASTRIQPGEAHENGVVEQAHDAVKSALAQALVLRGTATSRRSRRTTRSSPT